MFDRKEPMPYRFYELAVYNSEVARGIVHTDEWNEKMRTEREAFDDWKWSSIQDYLKRAEERRGD